MRVAQRDRDAAHFTLREREQKLLADDGLPHGKLKIILFLTVREQGTSFKAGTGTNDDLPFCLFRAEIGGHAACSVARQFRRAPIGVNQVCPYVSILGGKQPLDTVGTDTLVAVGNTPAEGSDIGGGVATLDNEKIIAARAGLDKGHPG